jgi:membrane-associated phospholipid phosphatase
MAPTVPVGVDRLAAMIRRRSGLLAALAVVVGTGLLAAERTPYGWERWIGQQLYDLPDAVRTVLEAVELAGTRVAIVVVAAVLVIVGRYRAAAAAALAGVAAWLVAAGLKEWVERPRPSLATLDRVPRETPDSFAWPSSHAAIAFALATVVLATVARGRVGRGLVVAAAGLTAVARVNLGAHWALDVLGGAALGILLALVALAVVKP